MPVLEVTEEQIVSLISALPPEARTRLLNRFTTAENPAKPDASPAALPRPRPVFGGARHVITYIADDFNVPLDDMKEYME